MKNSSLPVNKNSHLNGTSDGTVKYVLLVNDVPRGEFARMNTAMQYGAETFAGEDWYVKQENTPPVELVPSIHPEIIRALRPIAPRGYAWGNRPERAERAMSLPTHETSSM